MKKEKKPFEFYLITVLFLLLIIVSFLQVMFRFVLNLPLAWTEEFSRYVFIILVYLGASAAALEDKHVRVEVIDSLLPAGIKQILDVVVRLLCAAISIVMAYNIKDMIGNSMKTNQLSAALQMPISLMYVLVGLLFLLIAFRFIQKAWWLAKPHKEETA